MSLIHSLKWSFLAELVSKAISPVVFIVLARLLSPEDFGVMAAALMVIAFSQVFWEAGMGAALIQRQTDVKEAANAAFWINIGLGCIIAAALYVASESIASVFFQDPRVATVLQVMTLLVMLGAVSSVHTALLQKEMSFKKLFWIRFVTVSLPGIASIPLALNGMGYWALVVGALVGQVAQVLMLWYLSQWRPTWGFNAMVAKEMAQFGAWVGASGLLAWFYMWADSLIVGMYLGSHELGLYRMGNLFAMMIFAVLLGSIAPVLYSHLSRMGQNRQRLRNAIERVIKLIIMVSIPTGLIIYSLSDQIGAVLFGEKWEGVGFVLGVMALVHGFAWIVGMNGNVYRAMGKPSYETMVMAGSLVVYLGVYIYAINLSFESFVWARFVLVFGALALHFYVLNKVISVAILPIIRYLIFISVSVYFIISGTRWFLESYVDDSLNSLIVGGVLNIFLVGAFIYFIERKRLIPEITNLIKRRGL